MNVSAHIHAGVGGYITSMMIKFSCRLHLCCYTK